MLFVALATLATVWILQSVGYRPCELCLTERIAFYVGAPLAALTAFAAYRAAVVPARRRASTMGEDSSTLRPTRETMRSMICSR